MCLGVQAATELEAFQKELEATRKETEAQRVKATELETVLVNVLTQLEST